MAPPAPRPTPSDPPWPRSAQWALALVLGVAVVLLGGHFLLGRLGDPGPSRLDRAAAPTTTLDLNRADHAQLRQLPDVGEGMATRIEEHRRRRGGFRSVDELADVPGIGPTRLARLRPWLRVEGEQDPPDWEPTALSEKPPVHPVSRPKKAEGLSSPVDLNRASAEELQMLPGIGPVLAGRIIEARNKQAFRAVQDLRRVPGIGAKTLEKLRPFVAVVKDRTV